MNLENIEKTNMLVAEIRGHESDLALLTDGEIEVAVICHMVKTVLTISIETEEKDAPYQMLAARFVANVRLELMETIAKLKNELENL